MKANEAKTVSIISAEEQRKRMIDELRDNPLIVDAFHRIENAAKRGMLNTTTFAKTIQHAILLERFLSEMGYKCCHEEDRTLSDKANLRYEEIKDTFKDSRDALARVKEELGYEFTDIRYLVHIDWA